MTYVFTGTYLLFRKITSSNYNWNKLIPIVCFYNEIDRRRLGESCEGHLQCSGTVNAGVCGSYKTCTCNQGFFATHAGCLQGKFFFLLNSIALHIELQCICFMLHFLCKIVVSDWLRIIWNKVYPLSYGFMPNIW